MITVENCSTQRGHEAKKKGDSATQPQQHGPHPTEIIPFASHRKCSVQNKIPNPPPYIYILVKESE
jgi:hypothetical protein